MCVYGSVNALTWPYLGRRASRQDMVAVLHEHSGHLYSTSSDYIITQLVMDVRANLDVSHGL